MTVQGKSITVSSSDGLAAIDTGTTLIGAPSDIAQEFWSNVPGSAALSGQYQGMYSFRACFQLFLVSHSTHRMWHTACSTSISASISFGGTTWPISSDDMNLGVVSGVGSKQMCAGGVFDIGSTVGNGQGLPSWIVGDTFLKNVYSVFQADPPAVGFAQLANGLNSSSASLSSHSRSRNWVDVRCRCHGNGDLFGYRRRSTAHRIEYTRWSERRLLAANGPLDGARPRHVLLCRALFRLLMMQEHTRGGGIPLICALPITVAHS